MNSNKNPKLTPEDSPDELLEDFPKKCKRDLKKQIGESTSNFLGNAIIFSREIPAKYKDEFQKQIFKEYQRERYAVLLVGIEEDLQKHICRNLVKNQRKNHSRNPNSTSVDFFRDDTKKAFKISLS